MYEYRARIERVIDGDTIVATVDLGFSIYDKMSLRLYGINTPELIAADPSPGKAAKAFLEGLLLSPTPNGSQTGKDVTMKTYKDRSDKYGRMLAEIYLDGDAVSVNQKMIIAGHAITYFGGAR